jgi:serine phosphatase RsbU (regulator of sigma subunit)
LEKKKITSDTLSVLEWQKQTREMNRKNEDDLLAAEREMLKRQWALDQEKEKNLEKERQILNRERNIELMKHNQQEKGLREQAELAEKQRDL